MRGCTRARRRPYPSDWPTVGCAPARIISRSTCSSASSRPTKHQFDPATAIGPTKYERVVRQERNRETPTTPPELGFAAGSREGEVHRIDYAHPPRAHGGPDRDRFFPDDEPHYAPCNERRGIAESIPRSCATQVHRSRGREHTRGAFDLRAITAQPHPRQTGDGDYPDQEEPESSRRHSNRRLLRSGDIPEHWPSPVRSPASAAVAASAAPGIDSFLRRQRGDRECSGRVGPPPAGERIREQPGKQRDREVGADLILRGLGDGRG